jgi:regulator of sigma E protease
MDPGGAKTIQGAEGEAPETLPRVAPWQKILVALAGPAGNVVLAVLVSLFIFWVGKPAAPHETSSVVGFVDTNSTAYAEGMRAGDRILEVNGEPVENWLNVQMLTGLHRDVELKVASGDEVETYRLQTEEGFGGLLKVPGVNPPEFCKVVNVTPGSSAEKAGVRSGDLILRFDGREVYSTGHLMELVNSRQDQTVPMTVRRDGKEEQLTVTPAYNEEYGRALIGIGFNWFYLDKSKTVHPPPMQQMRQHAAPIFRMLKALVTPKEAKQAASQLGGPPAIFIMLWQIIKDSLIMALWFTAFLNVNLAILNLLPIPILDGGHIVFSIIEQITGRPMNEKLVGYVSTAFALLLIGLMLFLSYRDVNRFVIPMLKRGEADTEQEAAPTNAVPTNAAPAGAP